MDSKEALGRTAISKKDILVAATDLFLNDGYEKVSMRKIAGKIGCSPTNLYNHFTNKEEILLFLLQDGYSIFLTYLVEARHLHKDEGVLMKLKAAMRAYLQFGLDNPGYYKLMFIENMEHYDRIITGESDRMKGFNVLVELIHEAVSLKVISNHNEMVVSQSVWAALHGLTSLFIMFPTFDWNDRDALIDFHIDAFLKGLQH